MRFVSIKTLASSAAAIALAAISAFSVTACDGLAGAGADQAPTAAADPADLDEAPELEEAGLILLSKVSTVHTTRKAGATVNVSADTYYIASICGGRGTIMTHKEYDCCLDNGCMVKHDYYTNSFGEQCEDSSCDCGQGTATPKPGETTQADLNDMAYLGCLQK